METLEQILAKEKEHRHEDGMFGIKACKEHIHWEVTFRTKREIVHRELNGYTILFDLLGEYLERAQNDKLFNRAMILACWELINER